MFFLIVTHLMIWGFLLVRGFWADRIVDFVKVYAPTGQKLLLPTGAPLLRKPPARMGFWPIENTWRTAPDFAWTGRQTSEEDDGRHYPVLGSRLIFQRWGAGFTPTPRRFFEVMNIVFHYLRRFPRPGGWKIDRCVMGNLSGDVGMMRRL